MRDLVEFLKSLTDDGLLTNPAFADPWKRGLTPTQRASAST